MRKSIIVRRDFKLQGLGLPETQIKPLFETSMIYDFKYSEEEVSNKEGNKCTRRTVSYNNDTIKADRYVCQMPDNENIPDVYKGLKFFTAINPFSKEQWDVEWDLSDCNLGFALLLFKLGYCDSVYCRHGAFGIRMAAEPIISVDPERRKSLRKFTEEQWKDFLDQIDIKDFGWVLMVESYILSYDRKWSSVTEHRFEDCWDSSEDDVSNRDTSNSVNDTEFYKLSHEDRVAGISLIKFFDIVGGYLDKSDDYDYVPVFKTESEAKYLENVLKSNYTQYNGEKHKRELYVQPLSIKFQKFICNFIEKNSGK